MTKVTIVPIRSQEGNVSYQAMAGNKLSQGKTPGEALDALIEQLSEEEAGGTLVIVQNLRPDRFPPSNNRIN